MTLASLSRRTFLQLSAATTAAHALPTPATPGNFRFAVIADSHIIDEFYVPGSENSPLDNASILVTKPRLIAARDTINAAHPIDGKLVDHVFLVGDCFHNYPSNDPDFYQKNRTRIDICADLLAGFHAPVHLGFGNHDYGSRAQNRISRETSHQLFRQKLHAEPYSSIDIANFRFLHLNNFLGRTWDPGQPTSGHNIGTLGETQLQWAEAQLAARKPTVVFVHYPLWYIRPTEFADFGLHPLLRKYQDSIQIVLSGHYHKWIDFNHTYGPQHTVLAATRYDPNAFMLFDADPRTGQIRWLDRNRPEWSTHYATPYRQA